MILLCKVFLSFITWKYKIFPCVVIFYVLHLLIETISQVIINLLTGLYSLDWRKIFQTYSTVYSSVAVTLCSSCVGITLCPSVLSFYDSHCHYYLLVINMNIRSIQHIFRFIFQLIHNKFYVFIFTQQCSGNLFSFRFLFFLSLWFFTKSCTTVIHHWYMITYHLSMLRNQWPFLV